MKENTILAKYYDLLYSGREIKEESDKIIKLWQKYKKTDNKNILDIACGTGSHLKHIDSGRYNLYGLDLEKDMLNVAKNKNISTTLLQANMINFKINQKFGLIYNIFNSANYLESEKEFEEMIKNIYEYLESGGVFVLDLFYDIRFFKNKGSFLRTGESNEKDIMIARMTKFDVGGKDVYFNNHFLISEVGKNIKHVVDDAKIHIFGEEFVIKVLKENNFDVFFIKEKLYNDKIFVAVKK